MLTTIVPPMVSPEMWESEYPVHEYTEQELRGIEIYKSEGCVYCHTQQIRHLASDKRRYGWRLVEAPESESWEYVNDRIQLSRHQAHRSRPGTRRRKIFIRMALGPFQGSAQHG